MGALKLKANTTVTQFEEQEVSLRALDVVPELTQVRAGLDLDWVKIIAQGIVNGDAIPPVVVWRVVGRDNLLLGDGFHRHAAHVRLGLKSIRAQIREGTLEDALLSSLDTNTAKYHRGRKFEDADRRNTIELMIRNEEFRVWPDGQIGRRCGVTGGTVYAARVRLRDRLGIALPERVRRFSQGQPTDTWRRYRPDSRPIPIRNGSGVFEANLDGGRIYLGSDPVRADRRLASVLAEREGMAANLREPRHFAMHLVRRGVNAEAVGDRIGGIRIGDCYVATLQDDEKSLGAIGRCFLAIKAFDWVKELIVCAYRDRNTGNYSMHAAREPHPVKFLTPEELIARFAPTPTD
jgi:hypothetical protein